MPGQGFTGCHVDWVYMGRGKVHFVSINFPLISEVKRAFPYFLGTRELLTCWIPFGNISVEMGTLAVLEGSNHSPEFEKIRTTYGQMDAEAMQLKGKWNKLLNLF